jgi:hypothetical protein
VVVKSKELILKQMLSVPCTTCGAAVEEVCELHTALRARNHTETGSSPLPKLWKQKSRNSPSQRADDWNRKTVITFSGPVEVPVQRRNDLSYARTLYARTRSDSPLQPLSLSDLKQNRRNPATAVSFADSFTLQSWRRQGFWAATELVNE